MGQPEAGKFGQQVHELDDGYAYSVPGSSADFEWKLTPGSSALLWSNSAYDTLTNCRSIQFDDLIVSIDDAGQITTSERHSPVVDPEETAAAQEGKPGGRHEEAPSSESDNLSDLVPTSTPVFESTSPLEQDDVVASINVSQLEDEQSKSDNPVADGAVLIDAKDYSTDPIRGDLVISKAWAGHGDVEILGNSVMAYRAEEGHNNQDDVTFIVSDGHWSTEVMKVRLENLQPVLELGSQLVPDQYDAMEAEVSLDIGTYIGDLLVDGDVSVEVGGLPPGLSYNAVRMVIEGVVAGDEPDGQSYPVQINIYTQDRQFIRTRFKWVVRDEQAISREAALRAVPPISSQSDAAAAAVLFSVANQAALAARTFLPDRAPAEGKATTTASAFELQRSGRLTGEEGQNTVIGSEGNQIFDLQTGQPAAADDEEREESGELNQSVQSPNLSTKSEGPSGAPPSSPALSDDEVIDPDDGGGGPAIVNEAPFAGTPAPIGTPEDVVQSGIDVLSAAFDPEGDALLVTSATASHGAVVINPDNTLTYTPDPDYNGADTIAYSIVDTAGNAASGILSVNVAPVNDAPVAGLVPGQTTNEDAAIITDVVSSAADIDGDILAVSSASATNGVVTINPDQTITYTPNADFNGSDTVTYTIDDGNGGVDTGSYGVTIIPVNDAPRPNSDSGSVFEDGSVVIDVLANDTDIDGILDPATVQITGTVSAGDPLVVPGEGTWSVNTSTGEITFTPLADYDGPVTDITYTVADDLGARSGSVSVSVSITPVNDAPVAIVDSDTVLEDGSIVIDVLANDSDIDSTLDPATVQITGTASAGDPLVVLGEGIWSVNTTTGEITFTPDTDYDGPVTDISYTVNDNNGATSNTATVSVSITGINDNPVAGSVPDAGTNEDTAANNIDVLSFASDVDGDTVSVTAASATNGSVVVNPDGTLNYTPNTDYNGTDTITYDLSDGNGGTDTGTLDIIVAPVNDDPDAGTPPLSNTNEDTTLTNIDVLSFASDIDGDVLSVTGPTATNGTVLVNPDGSLNYTPNLNFNGVDTISYTIDDGNGGTDTGSKLVFVNAVNDAPVASDDADTVLEDGAISINVLGNDTDVDGALDPATVQIGGTASAGDPLIVPGEGTWTVNTITGEITFTPEAEYVGSVTDITYTVEDDGGLVSNPAAVSVSITPVNDAPVATGDSDTVVEDGSVVIDVLANDSDIDGTLDPATVQITGTVSAGDPLAVPGEGTWSVNTLTGEITFTPEADYAGSVTDITYTVDDDGGLSSNPATVSVSITPVNDAPVAVVDSDSVLEDGAVVIDILANDTDIDGTLDPATVQITGTASAGDPLAVPGEGTWSVNTITGEITFIPEADYVGSVTDITYTVDDNNGATSNAATVSVSITPVNDAPVTTSDSDTVVEDGSVVIDVLANDSDIDGTLDPATVQITGSASAGDPLVVAGEGTWTVNTLTGEITFTPEADYAGSVTDITYTVDDNGGLSSNLATVSVSITPANDAPVAVVDSDSVLEDGAVVIDILANDTDIDGTLDPATVQITGTASAGDPLAVPGEGTWSVNTITGEITFTPEADYVGSVTDITYMVDDNNGATSNAATVSVSITPVNDAPVTTSDIDTVLEDGSVVIDVLANDSDIDGTLDPATVQITGTALAGDPLVVGGEGTWTVNTTTGEITFTPEADYIGSVTDITYTVRDNLGAVSNPSSVSVSIIDTNDAPDLDLDSLTGGVDSSSTFVEDAGAVTIASADVLSLDPEDAVSRIFVTLDALPDGASEELTVNAPSFALNADASGTTTLGSGLQIAYAYTALTRELVINHFTGPGTPLTNLDVEEAIESLSYLNTSDNPTTSDRTFTIVLEDMAALTSPPADAVVTVQPANDAPTDISATPGGVDENSLPGVTATTLSTTDPDTGDTFSYAITSDPSGYFEISGNQIVVKAGASIDYETAVSHDVTVEVTDSGGATYSELITIAVNDVNEAPTDLDGAGNNGTAINTDGGNAAYYQATDGGTLIGGLTEFTFETQFAIDDPAAFTSIELFSYFAGGGSDEIQLAIGNLSSPSPHIYFELNKSSDVNVSWNAAELLDGAHHTVSFAWSNAFGDWSFFMDGVEVASGSGHEVGEVLDPGGVLIFGKDQDATGGGLTTHEGFAGTFFDIRLFDDVRTPAEIAAGANATLPPSTSNMLANWQFGEGGNADIVDAVSGNDLILNQATGAGFTPSTPIAMVGLSEASPDGTVVATLTAQDVDAGDSHTFTITSDPSGFFEIVGNQLRVATGAALDYDGQEVHSVTVEAEDLGGLTTSQIFNIDVLNDVDNLAPTDIDALGRNGTSINHDSGNAAYYSPIDSAAIFGGLTELTVETQFAVQEFSGMTVIPLLGYENGSGNQFDLRIEDPNGSPQIRVRVDGQVLISTWDASPLLDGSIHTISFAWSSLGGVWEMYVDGVRLDDGTGLANGGSLDFTGTMVIGQDQDSEGGGFETDQVFNGTLYDVRIFDDVRTASEIALNAGDTVPANEGNMVANWQFGEGGGSQIVDVVSGNNLVLGQATGPGYSPSTPEASLGVFENSPDGSTIALLSALDPNYNETFTYAITSDPSGFFEIIGDQLVVASGASMDFATNPYHTITIEVTDEGGLTYSEDFTLAVLNDDGFVGGTPSQIIGTPNPDTLNGTNNTEFIYGLASDDVIMGNGGNDLIHGQDGADTIYGGAGDDVIFADREGQAMDLVDPTQTIVNTDLNDDQSGPSVVALADGRVLVSWYGDAQSNNSSDMTIHSQIMNADGTKNGSEQAISGLRVEGDNDIDMPPLSSTLLATGDVLVTWVTNDGLNQDGDKEAVFGAVFDTAVGSYGLPFQINETWTGHQSGPTVAAMDDGRALVVWYDEARDGAATAQVHGRVVNPDGTLTSAEFDIGSFGVTGVDWTDMNPITSVVLETGNVYVSWASYGLANVDGDGSAVVGVLVNPATGIVGEETIVNSYNTGNQSAPVAVALDYGGVFLVYYGASWNDDDVNMTLKGRFVDAGGNLDGPEFDIGTANVDGFDGVDMPPLTAAKNANGDILVSWVEAFSLGSDIVANLINVSSRSVGPNLQISDPTGQDLSGPVLVALSDGRFLATWYRNADDDNNGNMTVRAQLLNSDGTQDGAELVVGSHPVEGDDDIDMPPLTATLMADGNVFISWQSDDSADVTGGGNGSEVVSVILNTKTTTGADIIFGEDGNDIISGGDGDDTIDGGTGADTIDGGAGVDTVSFASATTGVTALFEDSDAGGIDGAFTGSTAGGKTGDAASDSYTSIESITGSDHNDAFYGTSTGMNANLGFGDDDFDNDATSTGIDTIFGQQGSDTIRTGDGDDFLSGGTGNDSLYGEDGDDLLEGGSGADVIDGGSGFDTVTYANATSGVDVLLADTDAFGIDGAHTSTAAGGQTGDAAGDTYSGIERVIGSNHDDRVYGLDTGTTAELGSGDDIFDNDATQIAVDDISGGDGNDLIRTGDGDDIITGEQGNDELRGEGGHDTISGGDDSDFIAGGAGDDFADGGADTDTYYANGFRADFTLIDNLDGTFTLRDDRPGSPEGTDLLTNIELIEYWDQTIGVNNPLSLDLDQSAPGSGYTTTFTEGGGPVSVSDNDVVSADPEDSISRIIVTISNMWDGADDQLTINAPVFSLDADASGTTLLGSGLTIAYAYTASTGELVLNHVGGPATPITNLQAEEAIESLAYENLSDNPIAIDREFTIVLEDMDANQSPAAISTIAISGTNDAPTAVFNNDSVTKDSFVIIDVLANDIDIDGTLDPASVQIGGTASPGDPLVVPGEGTWSVNTATGEIMFVPEPGYTGPVTNISYTVQDDGGALSNAASVSVSVTTASEDANSLWMATKADIISPSGAPGLSDWTAGEALKFSGPGMVLEPTNTTGSFSSVLDLNPFFDSGDVDIEALHYVRNDITVGSGANTFDLLAGDILFSIQDDDAIGGIPHFDNDVHVFRPTVPGDYSSGTISVLLDSLSTYDTRAITLVEQTTWVGDVLLQAGSFLYQDSYHDAEIRHFDGAEVGKGTTTGVKQTFLDSTGTFNVTENFVGLELLETETTIGGQTLAAGTLLVTQAQPDVVGDNSLAVDDSDIYALTVSKTAMGSGTSEATATPVFIGSKVGLSDNDEDIVALTTGPDENDAPTDIDAITGYAGTEINMDGGNAAYYKADDAGSLLGSLTQFTVETQFAVGDPTGVIYVPLFSYHVAGDQLEIGINSVSGTPVITVEVAGNQINLPGYNASELLDGEAHTTSFSWDNTVGSWEFFADGVSVTSGTGLSVAGSLDPGGVLVFGQEQDSPEGGFNTSESFRGTLYDIRVFDAVRTPAEILAGAGQTLTPAEPNMIANWTMDAGDNTVLADTVGGNDLTLQQVSGGGWTASSPVSTIAIAENSASGTVVAQLDSTDPDIGDTFTYSITSDPSGFFEIIGDEIRVKSGAALDSETASNHSIIVETMDAGGLTHAETFEIEVTNVNDNAPTDLIAAGNTGTSINTDGGNAAYWLASNPETIVGGLTSFTIEAQFSLANPTVDGETPPIFNYFTSGPGEEIELSIAHDTGYNPTPYIYLELGPDTAQLYSYDATALMDGGQHTLSYTWDNVAGDWEIFVDGVSVGTGAGLSVGHVIDATPGFMNFGQEQDAANASFSTNQVFAGTHNDIRIFDAVRTPAEIAAGVNATLPASEPNMIANWQFGPDEIATVVDVVSGNNLTLNQVSEPGFSPSSPAGVITVVEDEAIGSVVALLGTVDPDLADTFTYTLTSDPSGNFEIIGNQLLLATGATLDHDVDATHTVTIETEDSGGLTYSENITIEVSKAVVNTITGTSGADILNGTATNDEIYGLAGNDTINSGAGNDFVDGGEHDDIIDGGPGDDVLFGEEDDDIITGGAGNDSIHGGIDTDTAVYSGNRADYTVHDNLDGTYVITDNRGGSPDGTDALTNIQTLQFADQTLAIGTAVTATSPIAFDLSGDGRINVTGETTAKDKTDITEIGDTVQFDMDGDGDLETIEWLDGSGDALLVNNLDGNAANDMDGKRLFGDQGGTYDQGYQQLANFDANQDGSISSEEGDGLNLWVDDGDARLEEGELFTLEEMGISEISVELEAGAVDEEGRDLFRSTATRNDGSTVLTEDVWFAEVDLDDERQLHPDPTGPQPNDELLG